MWCVDFWPEYWAEDYWPKEGAAPPPPTEGLSTNHMVGIGMKRTFSQEPQLGGGGAFG